MSERAKDDADGSASAQGECPESRAVDEAITIGLRAAGLTERDRSPVACFLRREDDLWRECCGSDCDPCATTLARAVDRARAELAARGVDPGAAPTGVPEKREG